MKGIFSEKKRAIVLDTIEIKMCECESESEKTERECSLSLTLSLFFKWCHQPPGSLFDSSDWPDKWRFAHLLIIIHIALITIYPTQIKPST